jgi:hypothetical protein
MKECSILLLQTLDRLSPPFTATLCFLSEQCESLLTEVEAARVSVVETVEWSIPSWVPASELTQNIVWSVTDSR